MSATKHRQPNTSPERLAEIRDEAAYWDRFCSPKPARVFADLLAMLDEARAENRELRATVAALMQGDGGRVP